MALSVGQRMGAAHASSQFPAARNECMTKTKSLAARSSTSDFHFCNHSKPSILPMPATRLHVVKATQIDASLLRPFSLKRRLSNGGLGKRAGVPRASMDDFDFTAGPIDDVRPTFTRDAYEIPPPDLPKYADNPPRKRKARPKATPAQALVGSIIAGGCSVALFYFVRDSYFSLVMNPPVHYAPLHLEGDVNALICTFVAGFGGFAVLMFAVNSIGLALLAFKGLISPAPDAIKSE